MSRKPTYRVKFRRRRECRTDYYSRIKLLSSSTTRLVARITNSQIIAQLTDFDSTGDKTVFHATSKELAKHGWKGGANTPAAYLTGFLLGTKAKGKVTEAILDIGLQRPVPGAKIFAVAKGLQDSGITISIGEVVPSEDRLSGKHIEEYAKSIPDGERTKRFSAYIKNGIDPTKFTLHVQDVKKKLGVSDAPRKKEETQKEAKPEKGGKPANDPKDTKKQEKPKEQKKPEGEKGVKDAAGA